MADESSAAHLYNRLTALAYAVTQMAIQPRPPFSMADQPELLQLGTNCANTAAAFRQKPAAGISQAGLFAAQQKVEAALAMFTLISTSGATGLTREQVTAAVVAAIQAVATL